MVDLSRIVSVVQIENVRLRECVCRSPVQPSDMVELSADMSHDALVTQEPGDGVPLRINVNFVLEIRNAKGDKELVAEVRGVFELSYLLPDDERFTPEELHAFGQFNAVFNAWPYWRELVHASLARMSVPILTIPVYRLPSSEDATDDDALDPVE